MQEHRWLLVGGHPALELCNTLSWRRDVRKVIDRLGKFEDYGPWRDAMERRFGRPLPALADQSELGALAELRRRVVALLDTMVDGVVDGRAGADVLEPFAEQVRAATSRSVLSPAFPLRWEPRAEGQGALMDHFALEAFDLLTHDVSRVRRCDLDECGWFFVDTTRNRSRRWCLPDQCGNISRVRAYALRQRAAAVEG